MAQADLRRVERARRAVDQARMELVAAIVRAAEAKESYRDIGLAAGMSKGRIGQIVKEGKR